MKVDCRWLLADGDTRRFFDACATVCEPGCCGVDAFAFPASVRAEFAGRCELPADLCRVRRRLRAFVRAIGAREIAVSSEELNAVWDNGALAAEWFSEWIEWIEWALCERDEPPE